MSTALPETERMARKAVVSSNKPVGPLLVKNLFRLGYADIVVRSAEIAGLVTKKTGKNMTRQRVSAIMNAVKVEEETIALIAKGIGVKPEELLRDD